MGQSSSKKINSGTDNCNGINQEIVEDNHEDKEMSCKEQMEYILSLWLRTESVISFPPEIFTLIINEFTYHKRMDQNHIFIKYQRTKKSLVKVLLVGSERVGKTSFVDRYVLNKWQEEYKPTIGADFRSKDISFGTDSKKELTLQIWDTAGQERFQSLGVAFYRGSDVAFLCYDTTDRKSLMEKKEIWNPRLEEHIAGRPALKILMGTKCDLKDHRACSDEDVSEIVAGCKLDGALECSAKENINIDGMVKDLFDDHFIENKKQEMVAKFPFRI